jgi:transaldolase
LAGCDRLTISPQYLGELAKAEGTLTRKLDPKAPGKPPEPMKLDEKAFRWAFNEDAMGTEKLSEGIRAFAKDLGALRKMAAERLAA